MTEERQTPDLGTVLAKLEQPSAVEKFLKEILTPREYHDLMLRWALMSRLAAGVPQRTIAAELGISLCKITRGAKILKTRDSLVASFFK